MTRIDALLVGENTFGFHEFDEMAPGIETALGEDVAVTATTNPAALADLSTGEYDVVVDYLTDSFVGEDRIEAVRSFVADGGGYLGIHCASDLTSVHDGEGGIEHREEPNPVLRELLGGHFVGHPERSEFGVEVGADHPVTDGVHDFSVYDEPYRIEYDPEAVDVLARMDHPDDVDDYPVVWIREYGDGRLCYSSLGHTDEAFEREDHRRLLRNGIRWIAGN